MPYIVTADCRGMPMAKSPNVLTQVYQKLGGRAALGEEIASEADLARVVAQRIPLRALTHFTRSGFSEQEVAEYVIPPRTRRHRKVRREPLTVEESDRLGRLGRVYTLAREVPARSR